MPSKSNEKNIEVYTNEALPTLFIDNLKIDSRADDLYLLTFATSLPDQINEQVRMMVPKKNMKQMLDALCTQCDYFPKKEKSKKKTTTKQS